eukprot:19283-Heterococcus_DN1.PRE.2
MLITQAAVPRDDVCSSSSSTNFSAVVLPSQVFGAQISTAAITHLRHTTQSWSTCIVSEYTYIHAIDVTSIRTCVLFVRVVQVIVVHDEQSLSRSFASRSKQRYKLEQHSETHVGNILLHAEGSCGVVCACDRPCAVCGISVANRNAKTLLLLLLLQVSLQNCSSCTSLCSVSASQHSASTAKTTSCSSTATATATATATTSCWLRLLTSDTS